AALVAWMPRSTAGTSENEPRNLPMGVRAPSRITARSIRPSVGGWRVEAGLRHATDQAPPLLFGGAAPDPIALAVSNSPGKTDVAHLADPTAGQRQAGLLLGRG